MKQYLLSTYSGDEAGQRTTSPEQMQSFMARVVALEAEMEEAGAFVFGGALSGVDAATALRPGEGQAIMTDGPFVEAKEHIAGFYILNAKDLDSALDWGRKVVSAINQPIEVRPFHATGKVADHMPSAPTA